MRVFLDASVLIRAVERPQSDSAGLLDRVLAGGVEGVVDELVLEEVERFFREKRGRHFAWQYTEQLRRNVKVVSHADSKAFEAPLSTKLAPSARLHWGAARSAEVHAVVRDPEGPAYVEMGKRLATMGYERSAAPRP